VTTDDAESRHDRSGGVGDIDGNVGTVVTDPQGAVNTGSGHQYNTYIVDGVVGWVRRRDADRLRTLAEDHFRYLERRFVPPPGYDRAAETLTRAGAVLVAGQPGSGRRTAALMLLRSRGGSGRFRELSSRPDDEEILDADSVAAGDRVLFDLSSGPADRAELESHRVVLQSCGAHLVVVLPEDAEELVPDGFGPLVERIGRPDGSAVFGRHLRAEEVPCTPSVLQADDRLVSRLGEDPMRDLARLARLTREARDRAGGRGQPAGWLGEALSAVADRSREVAEQVGGNPDGRFRALLLAAAVFEGAAADVVAAVAGGMLTASRYPPNETHLLDRPGLGQRLTEIGVTTDGAGRVRFTRLAYGAAVRAHFWRNFPELRADLRDWVGACVVLPELTGEDQDQVVARLAEQCLNVDRASDIFRLARTWTDRSTAGRPMLTASLAAQALEYGLRDERVGREFRRQIYNWSRGPALSPDLAQVLITVCADVLAPTLPSSALVRLHHLAGHRDPAVRIEAGERLRLLAEQDGRLFRQLLRRLAGGLIVDSPEPAEIELFLRLSECDLSGSTRPGSTRLLATGAVRDLLIQCWTAALVHADSGTLRAPVERWLQAAAGRPDLEPLLDLLVAACDRRAGLLGRLYAIVRDWALGAGQAGDRLTRRGAAALFQQKRRAALGLTLVGAASTGPSEETTS
jgi:hypothetical protein